ncbi:MAG: hypothetical protein NTZ45_01695, partial [Methylococcales bacterium]|nr:hypothetical protein [Methylococcales bacterium]
MAYQLTVTSKDKPYNEIQNYSAFAAIKNDGSVVAWGNSDFGGTAPNNITNVKQIFSSGFAFAALKNDGSVVSWGTDGDGKNISTEISNIKTISSTESAFAALTIDGKVIAWGNADKGGSISSITDVKEIYSNNYAFAALKNDGSVVTWGDSNSGGSSLDVDLTHVDKIFSTRDAFAALKTDGSVVAWGASGGNITSTIKNKLNDSSYKVKNIYSTDAAFAALREDGTVVAWGSGNSGGFSSAVQDELNNVVKIFTNSISFSALREDGSVVTWGGDGGYVVNGISGNNNLPIFSTGYAFAAIKNDGSVVTWGDSYSGGETSVNKYDDSTFEWNKVPLTENALMGVNKIFSNGLAFAALKNDGSVATWGDSASGGDSSSVATQLNGTIDVKQIFTTGGGAFAALRVDGSVVTWGDSSAISSQLKLDIVSIANATTDDNYVLAPPPPPTPVNYAPTGSVSITGTPTQGQVLTASNNLADANGMGAVSYQWSNNSGAIQNAKQTTYTLTQADVGKTLSVTANYTDGDGFSNSVASALTTAVANVNDAPTGVV